MLGIGKENLYNLLLTLVFDALEASGRDVSVGINHVLGYLFLHFGVLRSVLRTEVGEDGEHSSHPESNACGRQTSARDNENTEDHGASWELLDKHTARAEIFFLVPFFAFSSSQPITYHAWCSFVNEFLPNEVLDSLKQFKEPLVAG